MCRNHYDKQRRNTEEYKEYLARPHNKEYQREYQRKYQRKYNEIHREEINRKTRERARKWRIDNPIKAKERDKEQRSKRTQEQRRDYKLRRKTIKLKAYVEDVNLQNLRGLYFDICYLCGITVTENSVSHEHLIPLSRGGYHSYDNSALAHKECNSRKSDKTVEEVVLLGIFPDAQRNLELFRKITI